MNERIKELIKQATVIMVPSSGEFAGQEFHDFDKEKFAELIIKECAWLADHTAVRGDVPSFQIKKYFGITS